MNPLLAQWLGTSVSAETTKVQSSAVVLMVGDLGRVCEWHQREKKTHINEVVRKGMMQIWLTRKVGLTKPTQTRWLGFDDVDYDNDINYSCLSKLPFKKIYIDVLASTM